MIDAVIFDFDGTLSSERLYIYGCFEALAEKIENRYGISDAAEKLITLFEESWDDTFGRLFRQEKVEFTDGDIKNLVHAYRQVSPVVTLYEDTIPAIRALKDKGIKVAVLTNGYHPIQSEKIRKSQLRDYLDAVEIPDTYGREFWKPDTRRCLELLSDLKVTPENTIYVGDSNGDYLLAKQAGIKMVYIVRQDKVNDFAYLDEVDYVIDSLVELERILD